MVNILAPYSLLFDNVKIEIIAFSTMKEYILFESKHLRHTKVNYIARYNGTIIIIKVILYKAKVKLKFLYDLFYEES